MNGEGVTYTVKELIGMLEKTISDQMNTIITRLDVIDHKLDEKATNTRAEALEKRLAATDERVARLELRSAGLEAVSKFQRWLIGTACAGVITTLIYIAAGGHP